MESVLAGLDGHCCMVYLDDILILGETFEENLSNLQAVLDRFRDCVCTGYFTCSGVDYLGYHTSGEGLPTSDDKPLPTSHVP